MHALAPCLPAGLPRSARAAFYGPYVELLGELTKSDKGKKYKQLAEVTEKEEVCTNDGTGAAERWSL